MMFIFGSTMDYVEGKMQSGFVFENPTKPAAAAAVSLSRSNGRISNAQSNIRASCRRASEDDAEPGKSLLVTAQQNDIDIEVLRGRSGMLNLPSNCFGRRFKKLPDASEEEEDMLDRHSCQNLRRLSNYGDGGTGRLSSQVPDETCNMMMSGDDFPFRPAKNDNQAIWSAYTRHEFVQQLGSGDLPDNASITTWVKIIYFSSTLPEPTPGRVSEALADIRQATAVSRQL